MTYYIDGITIKNDDTEETYNITKPQEAKEFLKLLNTLNYYHQSIEQLKDNYNLATLDKALSDGTIEKFNNKVEAFADIEAQVYIRKLKDGMGEII